MHRGKRCTAAVFDFMVAACGLVSCALSWSYDVSVQTLQQMSNTGYRFEEKDPFLLLSE
jgi:hypothetical protein